MNFELNEAQRALKDSVARLLADHHGLERYRAAAASEAGFSTEIRDRMVQMGLPAMLVPEAYGGIGGDATDLLVVMRECGRSLLASPLLSCSVLPAVALAHAGSEALRDRWLPALAAGEARIAWAHEGTAASRTYCSARPPITSSFPRALRAGTERPRVSRCS
ncbi:MAG: acyl-CoA dehydrogenase [Ramlibacter sp.]|nr:acyl-CoA dehydrogenase [Ramlibacter sp.]